MVNILFYGAIKIDHPSVILDNLYLVAYSGKRHLMASENNIASRRKYE